MGFLSSLFGDTPTKTTSNVASKFPEELKPYMEEITKAYQTQFQENLGKGYDPYTGKTIAGFTPEEIASQQGLKSLIGTQAPLQQEALNITRGTAREFDPKTTEEYMSPYLRSALDAQKQQAQRQYERTEVPQFEADAVRAGGMSGLGSRAGVEAAERATGQNMLLANIEAAGQQKAFEAAQKAKAEDRAVFKDQTAREAAAAQQIFNRSPEIFKGGILEQGLLQSMGEEKRDLAQSTLDEAYLKYAAKKNFGANELAKYQQGIYGNPLSSAPNYNQSGTKSGGSPGFGKTLLGIAGTAAGFMGAPMPSDERIKTDITPVGKDSETGLELYAFRYKDDPKNYPKVIGPMAQDVEKKYPEAVTEVGLDDIKVIDMALLNEMSGGGISSTTQGKSYVERNMGGQVMQPINYRAVGGPLDQFGANELSKYEQGIYGNPLSPAPMMPPQDPNRPVMPPTPPPVMPPTPPPVMPPTPATGLPSVIPSQAEQNAAVSDGSVTSFADYDQAEKDLQLKAAVDKFKEGYDPSAVAPTPKPTSVAQPVDNFNFTGDPDVLPPDEFLGTLFDKTGGGFPQPLPVDQPGQATPYSPYLGNRPPPNFPAQELGGKIAFNDPFYRGPALFDQIGPQANLDSQYSPYGNNSIAPRPGGLPSLEKTFLGQGSNLEGFNSAMKLQPFESSLFNRQAGGPVMPIVYRQEGEKVFKNLSGRGRMALPSIRKLEKREDEVKKIREEGIGSALAGIVQSPVERYQVDEPGDPTGGGQANFKPKVGGLSTLSDGTGQSTPDATQADIDKFLQAQGNKQGQTAGDRTDQEDAGMVIKGYINGEPVYGPPPSALPDPGKETGPSGMTSPKEAAQIATTAAEKVAKNTFDSALVMQNINKKTSTEVKGLLNSFAEKYKARAENDPYKMQKFWFTVGANIMKKGNAFANMAEGLRIAVNDLDATRKEKDKLLMDLEDTMTKSKIKLAGKEGESDIAYEKLNLTQKNMIAKLGTTGLAAFNKQMKANGDYIAALAAAKKADNAARKLDAKERKEGQLTIADQRRLTEVVTERLSDIAGGYFRKGASIGVKATKYKRDLDNAFQDMYIRKGKKAADDFLAFTLKQDMPNFSKMFSKKTKK